jgi:hypothetical protein
MTLRAVLTALALVAPPAPSTEPGPVCSPSSTDGAFHACTLELRHGHSYLLHTECGSAAVREMLVRDAEGESVPRSSVAQTCPDGEPSRAFMFHVPCSLHETSSFLVQQARPCERAEPAAPSAHTRTRPNRAATTAKLRAAAW